ncbi:putative nuclease HARBI1 [Ochlerotatus camptorhynchus]|uniref:putative nuclease HARBI1 n=1 Tax=Ochlerotatus camptorhynchus TaxID=644619 RepID=UPI0031D92944
MQNVAIALAASAVQLLESETETDSDSDFEDHILMTINKRKRVENFVSDVVENLSEEEFRRHFRLYKSTAETIIRRYAESEFYRSNTGIGRRNVSANDQMCAFLWFCANKNSYREIGTLFNMSETSFYKCLNKILDFFYNLSKEIIRFPETEAEMEKIVTGFKSIAGFPDVIGCIDGSYIAIRKPANKIRSTYINRHDMLSMTLQGVCDPNRRFLDVCVGSPSRIHDSRVFSLSPISDDLPGICQGRYHLLGDAAYPVREYLLIPYKDYGNLTIKQRNYNRKHCQTRVRIENSFGVLKQRFRQLTRLDFFHVERMCKFVIACCTLHNMCIDQNDHYEEDEDPDEINDETRGNVPNNLPTGSQSSRNATLRRLGELKRTEISENLM